ncbi:unnamed protein product [Cylicostephanus goldi]|uniref:Uncharacterized protein n=1 Tax=Cylicostephanus goldi TaxID=71465 RepID=A0A3P6TQC1_CYLGO|nr:unnamed protein product [Cylicostephanus goldi]
MIWVIFSGSSSARSAHPATTGISATYQVPASASLVGKLPVNPNNSAVGPNASPQLKTPAAIAQIPIPLQKSGSQISHAPTEPVIKEDEDESSESSGGANGVTTITHLPIIGGAPVAQSPLPPAEEVAPEMKTSVSVTPEREHKLVFFCIY